MKKFTFRWKNFTLVISAENEAATRTRQKIALASVCGVYQMGQNAFPHLDKTLQEEIIRNMVLIRTEEIISETS